MLTNPTWAALNSSSFTVACVTAIALVTGRVWRGADEAELSQLPFAESKKELVHAQFPRRSECTRQYILARRRQANMRVSHLSPAARNPQ